MKIGFLGLSDYGFRYLKYIVGKSVVPLVDIPAGATISKEMISVKKPGTGIPSSRFGEENQAGTGLFHIRRIDTNSVDRR